MLRATTACTFSTSQLRKVLRTCCVFSFFTCKCASRHNGVHFSTSQLRRVFQTWCIFSFSLANVLCATTAYNFPSLIWPDGSAPAALASLLFDPPEPQIIGKTQCFATFLLFSSGTFSCLIFFLLLFSDSSHFCFSSLHIVGRLTSKLPSIILYYLYVSYIYYIYYVNIICMFYYRFIYIYICVYHSLNGCTPTRWKW